MKYFATIDELFDFKYLLIEDDLKDLSADMLNKSRDIEVITNISSELDPTSELILRSDRNLKIYSRVLEDCDKNEPIIIDSVKKILSSIDLIKKTNSNILIINPVIATYLVDHENFKHIKSIDDSLSANPYYIGNIEDLHIIVDPCMSSNNTKAYFYSKKKIKVAAYIKSVKQISTDTFRPQLSTIICTFISSESPMNIIDFKINASDLI